MSKGSAARWTVLAVVGVGAVVAQLVYGGRAAEAEPAPAYELVDLPEGVDTLSSFQEVAFRLAACDDPCTEVVYVWTPRMPLSRSAIPHVVSAAERVGAGVSLVGFEELERFAEAGPVEGVAAPLVETMLAAGALSHAPALVVIRGDEAVGPAVLGYKGADAYEAMLARRLAGFSGDASATGITAGDIQVGGAATGDAVAPLALTDFPAVGVPGAYFKWVPGRQAIAYEADRRIYLLDMDDGRSRVAPGFVDFVPTPDGRYFVTPLERSAGLAFYDGEEVFRAAAEGRSGDVRPFAADDLMRDQYPSVGILSQEGSTVRYRVLTSWFEGLRYRDYEIEGGEGGVPPTVRGLSAPIVPCGGMRLSTPMMSQDGMEIAARDEASGTTKVYRIVSEGRCEEVAALGMPTRKVAWHPSGRKLAFSTPRVRTASGGGGADPGIFVYDLDRRRLTRVADSDAASQLAFPDFIGDDAIVFMIPSRVDGGESVFRMVQPIP